MFNGDFGLNALLKSLLHAKSLSSRRVRTFLPWIEGLEDRNVPAGISISAAAAQESSGAIEFIVNLTQAESYPVSVDYTTQSGSASEDVDYQATSGTLIINPGETTGAIYVQIYDDGDVEVDENFQVVLSNPSVSDSIDVPSAEGTVQDDDSPSQPSITISDVSESESVGAFVFTVSLSHSSADWVTVDFVTVDGSATTSDPDYDATSGTLVFAPGETSHTISVTVNDDSTIESDENFYVELSNLSGADAGDMTGEGNILNDESSPSLPELYIDDVSVAENEGSVTFTVTLANGDGNTVTVDYSTVHISADGGDYASSTGSLTFLSGETTHYITIAINNDSQYEGGESFEVVLSNASGASIVDGSGSGTILEDEIGISIDGISNDEGSNDFTFTVNLTASSSDTITVDYYTADGSAVAGGDYETASGSLSFAPGETSRTITITVYDDGDAENEEEFYVLLHSASGASIVNDTGTGVIQNDDPPQISISDATAVEDAGLGVITFTLTLSHAVAYAVSAEYITQAGTAVDGADYSGSSGSIHFDPGQTTASITINLIDDDLVEDNETLFVQLVNANGGVIADDTGEGTIFDDEPHLSIADISALENSNGFVFTVVLSRSDANPITVEFATADGSAEAGDDYLASSGTLTFNPGETIKTIQVTVIDDLFYEGNENFFLILSNVIGHAGLTNSTGAATILPNEPTFSINNVTQSEASGDFIFSVALSQASGQSITVGYATANGSATTSGSDYIGTSGTLTFNPGETTKTISVPINNDSAYEHNETFFVNLFDPSVYAGISDGSGLGTIVNNDSVPTLSISNVTQLENAGNMNFTVTLSAASGLTTTVVYVTSNVTAVSGSDFTATSGTLTFNPGETTKTISVNILNNSLFEISETFHVTLVNPSNATIATGIGVGTITNDDPAPSLSINDVTRAENLTSLTFTVTLSTVSGATTTVNYATVGVTALAGQDYTAASGVLAFNSGQTTRTITVTVVNDALYENTEIFHVVLSNASNAVISDTTGVGTITDNDSQPFLSINDVTQPEGGVFTVTVTLSTASGTTTTVDFATADVTALAGQDYTATSGALTFNPGQTTKTITVTVANDALYENTKIFHVVLSNASNAAISDNTGVGTITDNDPQPSMSISDVTQREGGTFAFTVTLSTASGVTTTVDYATADGSALAGQDYTAASGTLTFNPGVTSISVLVNTARDRLREGTETFFLDLIDSTNAVIADARGQATIMPPVTARFAVASNSGLPIIKVFDTARQVVLQITPFAGFPGRVTVATGDVSGDGVNDVIVGASLNGHVKVFDGVTGAELRSFLAFGVPVPFSINVGAGDLNGDGNAEVLVSVAQGGPAHVKAFDGATGAESASFYAHPPEFLIGGSITAGDINGDGFDDIIVGLGGNGHIKAFDGRAPDQLVLSFLAAPGLQRPISIASGDRNGDGFDDIIVGLSVNGQARTFNALDLALIEAISPQPGYTGGISVAAHDLDGDEIDELFTAATDAGPAHVIVFKSQVQRLDSFYAFNGLPIAGGLVS